MSTAPLVHASQPRIPLSANRWKTMIPDTLLLFFTQIMPPKEPHLTKIFTINCIINQCLKGQKRSRPKFIFDFSLPSTMIFLYLLYVTRSR